MKKLFALLAFILAVCPFLSACVEVNSPTVTPAALNTPAAPTPSPTVSPVVTPEPSDEGDEIGYDGDKILAYLQDCYSWQIEEANKCRVKKGDTEYYLDTSKIVEMDESIEFPLYRQQDEDFTEYLGTTGFSFQVFGNYIYVQSDPLQEDWPDGTLTRIVNLKDLSVTQAGRDMNIFIPKQGSKVYYTLDIGDNIYIANPSLKNPKKLHVEIPDRSIVEKKIKLSIHDVCESIGITDIKDGWINFNYSLDEIEGPSYYEGNYRINTDGSKIKKIGEGKFGDEEDSED